MTRYAGLGLVLICLVGALWTTSRADEDKSASGPVAELLSRIEKLEKRIAVLEDREQYTRQVNAVEPSELRVPQQIPQGNGIAPKAGTETTRPAAKVWLLKQTEQKPAAAAKN